MTLIVTGNTTGGGAEIKKTNLLFTNIRFFARVNTLMNNKLVESTEKSVAFITFKLFDVCKKFK